MRLLRLIYNHSNLFLRCNDNKQFQMASQFYGLETALASILKLLEFVRKKNNRIEHLFDLIQRQINHKYRNDFVLIPKELSK